MKNNFLIKNNNNKESNSKNIDKLYNLKKGRSNFIFAQTKKNKNANDNNIIHLSNKNQEKQSKINITKPKFKIQKPLIYNRNLNDYNQFLTEYTNTHNGNLSWAIKLREDPKKTYETPKKDKTLKIKIKLSSKVKNKGIALTDNFKEPKFYIEDLEKYKIKLKKQKRPLSSIANPNFNNIRHLFINRNGGELSNEFASSLRYYSEKKTKKEKAQWNKYFNNNKENKELIRFLLPVTQEGKQNFKKFEKRIYRPYNFLYKDIIVGNDTIKQKVLSPKKDYSYGGIGEHLNMGSYNNHYGVFNSCQFENLLKSGNTSQCFFELGLRNYKYFTKKNKINK